MRPATWSWKSLPMRPMPWAARLQKVLVSAMLGSSSYVLTVYKDSATFPLSAFLVKTFFCRFSSRISTCWNPSSLATTVNFWGQKIITLENENHRLKAKLEALRGRWLWKSLGDVNAAGAASGKQEPAAAAAHSSESFGCSTLTYFSVSMHYFSQALNAVAAQFHQFLPAIRLAFWGDAKWLFSASRPARSCPTNSKDITITSQNCWDFLYFLYFLNPKTLNP